MSSALHYIITHSFSFLLKDFLLFFTNKEIGKFLVSLTDKELLNIVCQVLCFYYQQRLILSRSEVNMLISREIPLISINIGFYCISGKILFDDITILLTYI